MNENIIAPLVKKEKGKLVENARVDETKRRVFAFYGAFAVNIDEARIALKDTKVFFDSIKVEDIEYYSSHYTRTTFKGFLRYNKISEDEKDQVKRGFADGAEPLFEEILLPLVQKNGKRLSFDEASENLRKVIFRGHCMGSLLITNLGNMLVDKMGELGYSDDEIKGITSNVVALFSSSIVLPHEIRANFKIISYINLGDNELFKYSGEEWRGNLLYLAGAKNIPTEPTVFMLDINNLSFVLLSSLFDDDTLRELKDERERLFSEGDKAKTRKLDKVLLGHAWSLLTRPYKESEGVSKALEVIKEKVKAKLV